MRTLRRGLVSHAVILLLVASSRLEGQPEWRMSSEPVLRIADRGTDETLFQSVPNVLRLPDERILVAENRSAELRLFLPNGTFERRATRRGNGPNELGPISFASFSGGEVVAFDGVRTVWFDARTLRELRRINGTGHARVRASGALGNGTFFGTRVARGREINEIEDRIDRDSIEILLFRADTGVEPISIGKRPGSTFLMIKSKSARMGFRGAKLSFGNHLYTAAADDVLWFLDSEFDQISRVHSVTRKRDSFPLGMSRRGWDDAAIARERSRVVREFVSPADRELPLAQLDRRFRPATPPRWAGLYADVGNGVWVEEFRTEQGAPRVCRVLNGSGVEIARVRLPSTLIISEIGIDFVLGTENDGDGVPAVVRYSLARSAP